MATKTTKKPAKAGAPKTPKVKTIKTLGDLTLDPKNMNEGTERGKHLLATSLTKLGAGRSVVADRNGVVIAGNKTTEVAREAGFKNVIVVPADGETLVVVQRTDLDLADPEDQRARQLAFADNRVAEENLAWTPEAVTEIAAITDLSDYALPEELRTLTEIPATPPPAGTPAQPFTPNTSPDQARTTVTDSDVNKAEAGQSKSFTGVRQTIKLICPHCGKEFSLPRTALEDELKRDRSEETEE